MLEPLRNVTKIGELKEENTGLSLKFSECIFLVSVVSWDMLPATEKASNLLCLSFLDLLSPFCIAGLSVWDGFKTVVS